MVFYNPFTIELESVPAIVYPSKGLETVLDRKDKGCMEVYLNVIWGIYRGIISRDTEYIISILWNEGQDKMADLWLNRKVEEYGFGPLVEVRLFRNLGHYLPQPNEEEGHSCGNAIVVLGAEETHRAAAGSLKEYLSGPRPKLPERLSLGEDFYLE